MSDFKKMVSQWAAVFFRHLREAFLPKYSRSVRRNNSMSNGKNKNDFQIRDFFQLLFFTNRSGLQKMRKKDNRPRPPAFPFCNASPADCEENA